MSSRSQKTQRKPRDVLAGNTPELILLRAVRRYVEHHGGKILVIGGIEVQTWPEDRALNFRIGIRCTGRRPEVPKAAA